MFNLFGKPQPQPQPRVIGRKYMLAKKQSDIKAEAYHAAREIKSNGSSCDWNFEQSN